jgi:aminopeptidase-like protein/spore coat polysaccharide biosynthesis protein SpsF (cytidylyltransferase family)
MSKTVALVQARMGSTRFPGKMLALLNGRPILEWVLNRVMLANLVDAVVLATSDLAQDDPLTELATRLGISVFRGSEADVLGRLACASAMAKADTVIRVCADNPFIDAAEIDRLIRYYNEHVCDYACNHQDRLGSGYADGFGAEVLSNALLQHLALTVTQVRYREHATLYLWEHPDQFILNAVQAPNRIAFPELRFDVDSPQDLEALQQLTDAGVGIESTAVEIVSIAQRDRRPASADFSGVATAATIDAYLKRLFPLCRSITGDPNRQTLGILQEIIPLTVHEVPTGTEVYDWVIPDEWTIRDAWIADAGGKRIVDFRENNLHLVSYSVPVNAQMTWSELAPHIHRHPDLPEAIPYRTSYYKHDWGFCITQAQYEELATTLGLLTIVIDSELKPGSLTYGEYLIPGRSKKEILLSCYICHPSMANDSLSGVLLTVFLAQHISSIKDRNWSYRVVFVPETIGAIAYCSLNEAAMKQIDFGLVITTVGGPGKFGYKQSWDPTHFINELIERVLGEATGEFLTYPFDIHGSDERQYSSLGFRINTATVSKDRYYEYAYYHCSLDDPCFVRAEYILETLSVYKAIIKDVEALKIYRNTSPQCEVMLSRHSLYPKQGGMLKPELGGQSELDIILWLLFLCDGNQPIQNIANRLGVDLSDLRSVIKKLKKINLLVEV